MKLRNKKTGEIVSLSLYGISLNIRKAEQPTYHSIEQLCEEWEDAEAPRIKDPKIRKAVRAWAEAIGTTSAFVEQGSFDNEHLELSDVLCRICFAAKRPKDIKPGIRYTIAELCGEEEE